MTYLKLEVHVFIPLLISLRVLAMDLLVAIVVKIIVIELYWYFGPVRILVLNELHGAYSVWDWLKAISVRLVWI